MVNVALKNHQNSVKNAVLEKKLKKIKKSLQFVKKSSIFVKPTRLKRWIKCVEIASLRSQ